MAPTKKDTTSSGEAKELKYLLSVIASCDTFQPSWKTVAADNNIGYARNASKKFRELIEKNGYAVKAAGISKVDVQLGSGSKDKAEAAGATQTGASGCKATMSAKKKRRLEDETTGNDEEPENL